MTTIETAADEEESKKNRTEVVELLFLSDEKVEFPDDVYGLTIAANMTKDINPALIQFGIR